ncbi:MAG: LysR family transcriptional regulator [Lachnospiraceae bacterium]|nr:LysR family transcriptional regulator [Lachnospiraceae bacterium]
MEAYMDIDLHGNYVLCIYKEGNLSRAAKQLGISQPALSMAISNLEKKLGYKIFDKSTLPFTLTAEGKIYLDFLKNQQLAIKDYRQKLNEFYDCGTGEVTIGAPVVYVDSMISAAVAKLHKEYPKYKINIKSVPVPELIELTKLGEVDCFISTQSNLPDTFIKEEIKSVEKLYMCIPMSWEINSKLTDYQVIPGKESKCFDFSLLNNMEFIFLEENQPLQIELRKFLNKNDINFNNHIVVNQVSSALSMCAQGIGICFVQEEVLKNSRILNDICVYSLPDVVSGRKIYVSYDKDRYVSRACQNLIEILKSLS